MAEDTAGWKATGLQRAYMRLAGVQESGPSPQRLASKAPMRLDVSKLPVDMHKLPRQTTWFQANALSALPHCANDSAADLQNDSLLGRNRLHQASRHVRRVHARGGVWQGPPAFGSATSSSSVEYCRRHGQWAQPLALLLLCLFSAYYTRLYSFRPRLSLYPSSPRSCTAPLTLLFASTLGRLV